jgi:hypothetical protein
VGAVRRGGVSLFELGVLRSDQLCLVACGLRLERCPLDIELARCQLLEGGPIEVGARAECCEGLVGAAGCEEGVGDRAEDEATGVRNVVPEPLEFGVRW